MADQKNMTKVVTPEGQDVRTPQGMTPEPGRVRYFKPTNSVRTQEEAHQLISELEDATKRFRSIFEGETEPDGSELNLGARVESLGMRIAWCLGNPFRQASGARPADQVTATAAAG